MQEFTYRGRNHKGKLVVGERSAESEDALCNDLIKIGVFPVNIEKSSHMPVESEDVLARFESNATYFEELAIFSRQMQVLHSAGVPIITALQQIGTYTRSTKLSLAITGIIDHIERGEKLSAAMARFPKAFSPLIISIVQIGENTGELSESFKHLHEYLSFESENIKQFKSAFRYPIFVSIAILIAILVLNIFVIPSFAGFYSNMNVSLPWQTRVLIASSNLFTHYGHIVFATFAAFSYAFYRFKKKPGGQYAIDKIKLHLPIFGKIIKRILLTHLSQTMAIIINSGVPLSNAFKLTKDVLQSEYVRKQLEDAQKELAHGKEFTIAIGKIELFSPLELQILTVGEKNGELGSAMSYIGEFHQHEIQFDVKRLNDWIGPALIAFTSVLILIVALGIYLPIWNMINLNR